MDSLADGLAFIFDTEVKENISFEDASSSKEKKGGKRQRDIRCPVCDTNFSTKEYYERHLGTKKHRRNEKSLRKEILYRENLPIQEARDLEDKCSYKGIREIYRQRHNRNYESNYTSYLGSVVAYWASTLIVNPTVIDFKISLNDKQWGTFGDAVIEIEFKDFPPRPSVTKTFAIHFKHIVSNNLRNVDSISHGSFRFANVISKLATVKSQKNFDDVTFVIFTTAIMTTALNLKDSIQAVFCSVCFKLQFRCTCSNKNQLKEVPVYAKPRSGRTRSIINTSDDPQSIFHFFSSDSKFVLPKIYFHTSQKRHRYFPESIDEIFFEKLNDRNASVARELIRYIENWSQGSCGGIYKLKKEEVLVKLGQLLLNKFVVTPKVEPMDPQSKFDIWLQAVESAHVTMLRDSVNLSEICEPMNLVIERELGLNIDIANEMVTFRKTSERDDVNRIANGVLKDYIFEESPRNFPVDFGDISMGKVYLIFWKAGLIPLILQVDNRKDQEYVLRVINVLKSFGLSRRYFVKTSDPNVKNFVGSFKNVSFFVTLDDIAEKLDQSLLSQVKINVAEGFSLNLNTIRRTDKFFLNNIFANEFFDMSLGRYFFKPFGNCLFNENNEELKLILDDHQIKILRQEVESKIDLSHVFKQECMSQRRYLRGLDPKLFG